MHLSPNPMDTDFNPPVWNDTPPSYCDYCHTGLNPMVIMPAPLKVSVFVVRRSRATLQPNQTSIPSVCRPRCYSYSCRLNAECWLVSLTPSTATRHMHPNTRSCIGMRNSKVSNCKQAAAKTFVISYPLLITVANKAQEKWRPLVQTSASLTAGLINSLPPRLRRDKN